MQPAYICIYIYYIYILYYVLYIYYRHCYTVYTVYTVYIHRYIDTYIHACIHTLHYITLHYITLHYITLHYIHTYIHAMTQHAMPCHAIPVQYIAYAKFSFGHHPNPRLSKFAQVDVLRDALKDVLHVVEIFSAQSEAREPRTRNRSLDPRRFFDV